MLPSQLEDGRIVYALGRGRGIYFSAEIRLAREMGYSLEYKEGNIWIFDQQQSSKSFLEPLMNDLFLLKEKTILPEKFFCKSILNTLGGPIGMNPDNYLDGWKSFIPSLEKNPEDLLGKNYAISEEFPGYILMNKEMNLSALGKGTNVAFSAAMTSYGRIFIYKKIQELVNLKIKIIAVDTDSITIDSKMPESLGGELGRLGSFRDVYGLIDKIFFFRERGYALFLPEEVKPLIKNSGISLTLSKKEVIHLFKILEKKGEVSFNYKGNIITYDRSRMSRLHLADGSSRPHNLG